MKTIRRAIFVAMLAVVSFCFVSCQDDDEILPAKTQVKTAQTQVKIRNGVVVRCRYTPKGYELRYVDTYRNDTLIKRVVNGIEFDVTKNEGVGVGSVYMKDGQEMQELESIRFVKGDTLVRLVLNGKEVDLTKPFYYYQYL